MALRLTGEVPVASLNVTRALSRVPATGRLVVILLIIGCVGGLDLNNAATKMGQACMPPTVAKALLGENAVLRAKLELAQRKLYRNECSQPIRRSRDTRGSANRASLSYLELSEASSIGTDTHGNSTDDRATQDPLDGPDREIALEILRDVRENLVQKNHSKAAEAVAQLEKFHYCEWKTSDPIMTISCDNSLRIEKVVTVGTFVPPSISKLPYLVRLNAICKEKSNFECENEIPDFTATTKLANIYIMGMKQKRIPLFPPSLEHLRLTKGVFETVGKAHEWRSLKSLKKLRVESQSLRMSFFEGMENVPGLKQLSVSFRSVGGGSDHGFFGNTPRALLGYKLSKFTWRHTNPNTTWDITNLPDYSSLKSLSISSVNLESVPDISPYRILKSARFIKCGLSDVPQTLLQVHTLRTVSVDRNNILDAEDNPVMKELVVRGVKVSTHGNPSSKKKEKKLRDAHILEQSSMLLEEVRGLAHVKVEQVAPFQTMKNLCAHPFFKCSHFHKAELQGIDLGNLGLSIFPPTLLKFDTIKELLLYGNHLKSLPNMESMESLMSLKVSRNLLTEIPASLMSLGLEVLILDSNGISKIPAPSPGAPVRSSLKLLGLSDNAVESVPAWLKDFKGLENIDLSKNKISRLLFKDFASFKHLANLYLDHNELPPDELDGMSLPNLVVLDLSYNELYRLPRFTPLSDVRKLQGAKKPRSFQTPYGIGAVGKFTQVQHIYLNGNGMKHMASNDLLSLVKGFSVNNFILDDNLLETVPEVLAGAYFSLCSFRRNKITDLPAKLFLLNTNVVLDFAHNNINALPQLKHENGTFLVPPKPSSWDESSDVVYTYRLSNNKIRYFSGDFVEMMGIQAERSSLYIENNPITVVSNSISLSPHGTLSMGIDRLPLVRPPSVADDLNMTDASANFTEKVTEAESERDLIMDPVIQERLRVLVGAHPGDERALIQAFDYSHLDIDLVPEFKKCVSFSYRVNGRTIHLVRCMCREKFYSSLENHDRCKQCPSLASCSMGKASCPATTFQERVDLPPSADPKSDLRPEMKCSSCPTGSVCDGHNVVAQSGFWKNESSSFVVHKCPNQEACIGGADSECSQGYTGLLCGKCSPGYYGSGAHTCVACPEPIISIIYFTISVIGMGVLAVAFFLLAASILEKQKSSENARKQRMAEVANALKSTSSLKVTVSFLQILTSLDMTFDIEWPNMMTLLDDLFGWVNMDIMKSTSLECVWELSSFSDGATRSTEDAGFGYRQKMAFAACIPICISLALYITYRLVKCLSKMKVVANRNNVDPVSFKRLCIHTHILVWQLCYLPVSYMAIQYFNCVTFDEGTTFYLHNDLSSRCYTDEYWPYAGAALAIIALYTLGLPLGIVTYVFVRRKHLYDERVLASVGIVYRSYKKEYAYWEAVEMTRKVIIGGGVVLLSGSSLFQLTVAMLVLFVFMILHCRCWPNHSRMTNIIQAMLLVLTYFTMSLGVLRSLEVPKSQAAVFSVVVIGADIVIVACVVLLLGYDLYCVAKDRVQKLVVEYQKRKVLLNKMLTEQ